MEARLTSTVEDGILDALNFKPSGNSAQYVLGSKRVKFFAEASDTFSLNSRVIRFRLVDQGFWEPASSRIVFTLHNNDGSNALVPISNHLGMFSRIRCFVSGIQVENSDFVGESCMVMDRLKGANRRLNDSIESHLLDSACGHVSRDRCRQGQTSHDDVALWDHSGKSEFLWRWSQAAQ